MKNNLVFGIITILIAGNAMAGECKLSKPIQIDQSLLSFGIKLKVSTDQAPKFASESKYEQGKDQLVLDLYMFNGGGAGPHVITAKMGIEGKSGSLGPNNYEPSIVESKVSLNRGAQVSTLVLSPITLQSPDGDHEIASTSKVSIENGLLTSVEITAPVQKAIYSDGQSEELQYTGEYQTICITTANI